MNVTTKNLIFRQRHRMHELRDDASDIAGSVTEQVFDQFEREVDGPPQNLTISIDSALHKVQPNKVYLPPMQDAG